jgi:hypothetical protein
MGLVFGPEIGIPSSTRYKLQPIQSDPERPSWVNSAAEKVQHDVPVGLYKFGKQASITGVFAVETLTTWGLLERIWQGLPGLEDLQDLRLRNVQGLDRDACILFTLKALGTSSLKSVDLRYKEGTTCKK